MIYEVYGFTPYRPEVQKAAEHTYCTCGMCCKYYGTIRDLLKAGF